MLNLSVAHGSQHDGGGLLANWEEDIKDVNIEPCDYKEDPSGYRVVYYADDKNAKHKKIRNKIENSYSIGASCLAKRLRRLKKAGFSAPMTEKAIRIISQKCFKCI